MEEGKHIKIKWKKKGKKREKRHHQQMSE